MPASTVCSTIPAYGWRGFYRKMRDQRIRIWGAAVDTLENTSRFAKGETLGPTTVIHLFNQPLAMTRPYEAYMGTLAIPRAVARAAEEHSIHVDLLLPAEQAGRGHRARRPRHPPRPHPRVDPRRQEPRPEARRSLGGVAGPSACTWWRTGGAARAGSRPSPSRAPMLRPTSSAPGRTRAGLPISSCATGTQPRPRPCRPPACPRPSTSTCPWPSSHPGSNAPWRTSIA